MLFKFFEILFNCKFYFIDPKPHNLVVLDDSGIEELKNILKGRRYFVLITRSNNLRKIYLSPKLIFFIFFYYRGNLFTAYIASLLKILSPKIVLTIIDNSPRFHILARQFKNKTKFLAIQNSARYHVNINKYFKKKNINVYDYKDYFIPNFFCFGQYEINHYKKNKIKILDFKKIGSIRVSNFKRKIRKKTIKIKYDICLISDDAYNFDNIFQLKGFEEGFAKIVKFTIRFCRENNLKFIFPMKRYIKDDKSNELKYFKKNLDKVEFNYLIKNSYKKKFKNEYSSYQKICESNVTLGSVTTMLREALSLRKKIMVCNFTPTNIYDFPQKKFFFLKNPSYKEFKKKLKIILSLSEKKYFNSLGKNKNYLIEDSYVIDANDEVNSFINSILKKN